jgi:hypothetical protein
MAVEDRDQLFEKALAQHLRGSNAESSASPSACPDAEILAAYHENTLAAEPAGVAKQHIQTCQRCQSILEQLNATDEIPLGVPAAAAQGGGGVHVLKPRRVHLWRWVAPAGAIAAAVLVWVGVRQNLSFHKPAATEVAKAVSAPPPAPPSMESLPDPIARAKPPQAAPLVAQLASPSPRTDAMKSRVKSPADEKNAMVYSSDAVTFLPGSESPAAPRPSGVAGARPEAPARAESKAEAEELSREIAAAELKQKLDTASNTLQEAVPAPQNRQQESAVASGALDRRAAAERDAASPKTSTKKDKAAAPAPTPPTAAEEQQMQGLTGYKESAATLLAKSTATHVILVSAPRGSSVWRLGSSNAILNSVDGGKTWKLQVSGTDTELVAGAATSDQICWVAGKAGTVLRTTDGGAHWQKLSSPTQDDLLSVTAIDARQATVSAAVGAYQTTDGGATWHRLASE